jgi:parallel beta-helix repeat protein
MQNGMWTKGLVLGIILLFVGASNIAALNVFTTQSPKPLDRGNWLYVGGNGPGNYTSIQSAINAASNGDTVFVYDDSSPYYEKVVVSKSINLIGEGKTTTKIDGQGSGSNNVVTVTANKVNISGFMIQHSPLNYHGISLNSNNNNISNNNISSNNGFGVYIISSSTSNMIIGNNIWNNAHEGITILGPNNNIINNNIISNNGFGIDIYYSAYSVYGYGNYIAKNNAAGIDLYHDTRYNILEANIIEENNWPCGIQSFFASNNTIIGNIIGPGNAPLYQGGIQLVEGRDTLVMSNILTDDCRIFMSDSYNNNISMNHISNNDIQPGIYLQGSYNNTIIGNEISGIENTGCIDLDYGSHSNTVIGNFLNLSCRGMLLSGTDNNTIMKNTFSDNDMGLRITTDANDVTGSDNNIIKENLFYDNILGIDIYDDYYQSNNNEFFHNNFKENNQNARDYLSNIWDNDYPSGGNYWDDYTGVDNNGDGIGDTQYHIPFGNNYDHYPLMTPYGPPHAGFTYTINGHTVVFNASKSYDYDGNIISYDWNFGDGTYGSGYLQSHTYGTSRSYSVALTVTDNEEKQDTTSKIIVVNLPPTFGSPNPANESIGNPITFTWSIPINDPEGDPFSWTLQCSNGQNNGGTGTTNGTKSLDLSGFALSTTYKVWVNATDPNGGGQYSRAWYTFTTRNANNDYYSTAEDTVRTIEAPGVLLNDTDADGDPLTTVKQSDPGHGTLTFYTNGSFKYTPSLDYYGVDSFTYKAYDGLVYSNVATVSINVIAVNDPPVVTDIPSQTISEGLTFATITLDDYVSDVDNTDAEMTWTYSGNEELTVSIVNRVATIIIPNPDWFGAETITFKVTDPGGLWDSDQATFTVANVNDPPNKPDRPSGETNGKINVEYTYTTKTVDIDGDPVYYKWDWGDNTQSNWLGPYESGVIVNASHTWTTKGSYSIKVKAKDPTGNESDWSDPLPISMPLDVVSGNTLLLKQLNQSPNAFPLLRQLLGY